jgi:hypothetical protein
MRKAIESFLRHPQMSTLPDREIARRLGISPSTVGSHRARLNGQPERVPTKKGPSLQTFLAALAEAEGPERVQAEVGKWWSTTTGGTVKWERSKKDPLVKFMQPATARERAALRGEGT